MSRKDLDGNDATCPVADGADPGTVAGVSDATYLVTSYHDGLTAESLLQVTSGHLTATAAGTPGTNGTLTLGLPSVISGASFGGASKLLKSATVDNQGRVTAMAEAVGGTDYEFPLTFSGASRVGNVVTITAGVTDHGALTGLSDNDHPQYALAATTVTAGAGLTGSGTLGAALTLDVVAADATIVVNADSIQAGVMQTANLANNSVTVGKMAQLAATSVLGNATGSLADPAAITASTNGHYLAMRAGALTFAAIVLGDVTGAGNSRIPTGNASGVLVDSAELTYVTATGLFTVTKAVSGAAVTAKLENSSNTASSHAVVHAAVGGTSGGNPGILFEVPSGSSIRAYVDNADSDIFKVVVGTGYPGVGSATNGSVGGLSFNPSTGSFNVGTTSGPPSLGLGEQITISQYLSSTSRLAIFSGNVSISGGAGFIARSNGGPDISFETLGSSFAGTSLRTNAATARLQATGALQILTTTGDLVLGAGSVETIAVKGSGANIGLWGSSSTNYQSMGKGVYWGPASAVPSGDPAANAVFEWVEAGKHKIRDENGIITTLN